MYILIEEYKYSLTEELKKVLHGVDALSSIDGKVSLNLVGYYYNTLLDDCVFILPKVVLDQNDWVFGHKKDRQNCRPEDIVNLKKNNSLTAEELNFIYKFAVWIYRAIVVYKNDVGNDTDIVCYERIAQIGDGHKRASNTYLDILLSLLNFNKNNQNFFLHIIKNLHKGFNKINWSRTIGTQTAFIQDDSPIYLKVINKKRQINFDEELFIIYFSIINYICDKYGFDKEINCNYQLITGKRFENYLHGFGKTRLMQIKYKYFSDKALELWKLCYAFFDESKQILVSSMQKEYLLVKSFYIVFESIIDNLIGDKTLPDGMDKKQEDGKIVDHLFTGKSLFNNSIQNIYYIGDSKYYKQGHAVGDESIYKQFTYARNAIQWNVDILKTNKETESKVKIRDGLTEGYNIIPNFFISAKMDCKFNYSIDGIGRTEGRKKQHKLYHIENRLFDRDTLLLYHYDVNFLFILSLYARNDSGQKEQWKNKIREKIREDIQNWLQDDYKFYVMKAKSGVDDKWYIKTHFKELIGKIYRPFKDEDIYSLAVLNNPDLISDNESLIKQLKNYFTVVECSLDTDPNEALSQVH